MIRVKTNLLKEDFVNRFAYYMSGYAFKAFSGISKARITIHGEEKIPQGEGAVIFTANHFTRIETLFLPYHIHAITKKPVWSLAAAELFQGGLKGILEAMGAVSTRDPKRDFLIVKSLITGQAECIIFPEGMMVKNKKITSDGDFSLYGDDHVLQRPHTGAATLALQTEFYRERLRRMQRINIKEFNRLVDLYEIRSPDEVLCQQTFIVPVNITYYPVRAKENVLSRIALNMMENPSQRVMDELLTEGTMIFSGVDVDIRFGDPINIKEYFFDSFIESDLTSRRGVNFSNRLSSHHVMKANAHEIMTRYMTSVYEMTTLNYDHIFASILKYMADTGEGIDEYDFRCRAFLATFACELSLHCNFHKSLYANQIHILTNDRFHRYETFINLAIETGVIEKRDGILYKSGSKFDEGYAFHTVRVENPISVIANEVEPLVKLQAYFSDLAVKSPSDISLLMSYRIEDRQFNGYLKDFNQYVGSLPLMNPFSERQRVSEDEEIEDELRLSGLSVDVESSTLDETLYGKTGADISPVKGMVSQELVVTETGERQEMAADELETASILSARHRPFIRQYLASESKMALYDNGRPRLLKSDNGNAGALLIHDYLSSPGELLPFARYLQNRGFTVYIPRLPGHGTAPENLTETLLIQWIEAVEEGLVLLRSLCRKKIVGGLGIGGILGLALQSKVSDLDALFMVAPPQKIKDYPGEFLTSGGLWSNMMKRAGLPLGEKEDWITYLPEIPEFRYSTHPVSCLKQVDMLLEQVETEIKEGEKNRDKDKTRDRDRDVAIIRRDGMREPIQQERAETAKHDLAGLNRGVEIPLLVVQARNNPFVNPRGAQKLFEMILAPVKEYYIFDIKRHVILRGVGSGRISSAIAGFLESVLKIFP